jgi:acyl carrier protein
VTAVRAADARRAVVELLADQLTARGLDGDALPDDFDLLGEELIDSFGLLELITALEERFGLELDFEDMDDEDLTVLGPFTRHVERMSATAATAG